MTNIDQLPKCVRKRVSNQNDKTKISFWKRRIFKPTYVRDGVKITSPNYCIEIQHQGKRVRWSLGPANPEVAAAKARDLFLFLISNGWEETLAKYRPSSAPSADPTIGEFVQAVQAVADLEPRTLAGYVNSLKKIVVDISGMSGDRRKFGSGKTHKAWLAKVHAVRLSVLSPTAVQTWKRDFLARAGQDPVSQRSARISCNSFLRCAKSLFAKKIVEHLSLQLPDPLPFANVEFEKRGNTKYRSEFDISLLIEQARNELAGNDPECFKIFALGCFAGLRRKEIDLLPWTAFRFAEGVLRIEQTIHFSGKSEDSLADVPLDAEVLELFRGYREQANGSEFVIRSDREPKPHLTYDYYRCGEAFDRLVAWLRSHGVRSKKPLHALRKEFGSQLCQAHGIYAASRALRHSSIAISAAFYTDSRARASVGLGHLLSAPNIVEFKQEVA
jgi:hypothetical protein